MLNDEMRQFLQGILDDSDENRIGNAKAAAGEIVGYLKNRGFADKDIVQFLAWSTGIFAGIDGTIQKREHEIFEAVFGAGLSYDEFFEAVKNFDGNDEKQLDQIIDSWPKDPKIALVMYGICVMAHDHTLTGRELDYIEALLA